MINQENSMRCNDQGKHILIAVDDSDSSERAVLYAANFLKTVPDIEITLFSILVLPDEDFFESEKERRDFMSQKSVEAENLLDDFRVILIHSGVPAHRVSAKLLVKKSASVAAAIINEQKQWGYCTVVVGRRHLTRKEEFIFGSTSSELLHNMPENVCLWIVE
jgi:nucleotide-binding universal stress UspA family protein